MTKPKIVKEEAVVPVDETVPAPTTADLTDEPTEPTEESVEEPAGEGEDEHPERPTRTAHGPRWTPEQARAAGLKAAAKRKQQLQEEAAKVGQLTPEQLQVLDRRLVNPVTYGDSRITLSVPGQWTLRWVNTSIEGRFDRATGMQGWVPVRPDELANRRQITNYKVTPDGYVSRGERMSEVLMRMPTAHYDRIQLRKTEINKRSMRPGKVKDAVNARLAQMGRGDLADVADRIRDVSVESVETVDLDPNDQPPTA